MTVENVSNKPVRIVFPIGSQDPQGGEDLALARMRTGVPIYQMLCYLALSLGSEDPISETTKISREEREDVLAALSYAGENFDVLTDSAEKFWGLDEKFPVDQVREFINSALERGAIR